VDVSILSDRGDRCIPYLSHYSRAFASSTILCPHRFRHTLRHNLSQPEGRNFDTEFPCSMQKARIGRVPPFCRWSLSQRVPTKQGHNRSRTFWSGPF